jgi:hypothetical protein
LNQPTWLVMTGGKLWTTVAGSQWASIASVDPTSGTVTPLAGSYYDPDLAVSPGDPSTLFVAEDGLSPGAIYRFDVSNPVPTQTAYNAHTDQENIEGLAVSPDGTRVIPASGWPYRFEELNASTLAPDGLVYPAKPYPSAAAVSASGLLAIGLDSGYSAPDVEVYQLGVPAPKFTASTNNPDGTANVLPHGLGLSATGNALFVAIKTSCGDTVLDTFFPGSSSTASIPVSCSPGSGGGSPPPSAGGGSPPPSSGGGPGPGGPGGSGGAPNPPQLKIGPTTRRVARPDVYLTLGAVRAGLLSMPSHRLIGYRYFFDASEIRCVKHATNVIFTAGGSRHTVSCKRRGPLLITPRLAPHRRYRITVQAVRMRRGRIVNRGPVRSGRLYMPGSEARWVPIPRLPPSA